MHLGLLLVTFLLPFLTSAAVVIRDPNTALEFSIPENANVVYVPDDHKSPLITTTLNDTSSSLPKRENRHTLWMCAETYWRGECVLFVFTKQGNLAELRDFWWPHARSAGPEVGTLCNFYSNQGPESDREMCIVGYNGFTEIRFPGVTEISSLPFPGPFFLPGFTKRKPIGTWEERITCIHCFQDPYWTG